MNNSRAIILAVTASVGLFASASSANAARLFATTRAGNWTSATTTLIAVPLNKFGDTSLTFRTTRNNEVVRIVYNAECGVLGPAGAWNTVEITVDGVEANPASGTQFNLCASVSTSAYNWTGAERQSWYTVAVPGFHTVQVLTAGMGGATQIWLGDTSLAVDRD